MEKPKTEEIERLVEIKKRQDFKRQGIPFDTKYNSYFYDTGTGKVIMLDEESKKIIKALFDMNVSVEEFTHILLTELTDDIAQFIKSENILCNPPVEHFLPLGEYMTEENIKCEQLIIELTV